MRRVLLAAVGLIGLGVFGAPAAAAACETDSCQRWLGLEPVLSTFPRDAAIVLEGSRHLEVCAEGLPAHVQVVVRSGCGPRQFASNPWAASGTPHHESLPGRG